MKNPRNNIYDEFYFERRNAELEDLLESDTSEPDTTNRKDI